jgi:hypothetical protein
MRRIPSCAPVMPKARSRSRPRADIASFSRIQVWIAQTTSAWRLAVAHLLCHT